MDLRPLMDEITLDVRDIVNTDFAYYTTENVPPSDDPGLSYEKNNQKKGKALTSCVLYVDIRDSVAMTENHSPKVMGKIYTAFTKAVIKVARIHNGHTRNIIGDRVMIVFPEASCFSNAVNCGVSINHISKIINENFKNVSFECGVGIDFGLMRVTKVGVPRRGKENQPNRGLVWAGIPANIASRLTDMGSKRVTRTMYELRMKPNMHNTLYGLMSSNVYTSRGYIPLNQLHGANNSPTQLLVTEEEYLKNLSIKDDVAHYGNRQLVSVDKKIEQYQYHSILITDRVFDGLLSEGQAPNLCNPHDWAVQKFPIRNVNCKVYGANFIWGI